MKHPLFTRGVSLLMALLMVLGMPAAALETTGQSDEEDAGTSSSADVTVSEETSPFDDSGDAVLADDSTAAETTVADEETTVADEETAEAETVVYLDDEGDYLAPEELAVRITVYLDETKTVSDDADQGYTGIVAFYDYNETDEEERLDSPYFFYYEDGQLQDEQELYVFAGSYLNLLSAPVEETGETEEAVAVYYAEETAVDEATDSEYLFAFNLASEDNGLYTGTYEDVNYVSGLADTVEITLTQDETTGGSPTLTWAAVDGAERYQIYRRTGTDGEWEEIGATAATTYTDSTVQVGTAYTYSVRAVYANDSLSAENAYEVAYTYRAAMTATAEADDDKVTSGEAGITVRWTEDEEATGYRVLRKASDESAWTVVADLTGSDTVTWKDTTGASNESYTYAVRAYYGSKTGEDREDYSAAVWSGYTATSAVVFLEAPELTYIYSVASGMTIRWTAVTGATGYRVYRKTSGSGWTAMNGGKTLTATTLSLTDTTAETGTSYFYTVRAIYASGYGPYYDTSGDATTAVSFHAVPAVSVTTSTSNTTGVVVSWSMDATATGYRLFRKTYGSSKWITVADVTDGSTVKYTDSTAVSGTVYYYTVRAYYGDASGISQDANYNSNLWSGYKSSSAIGYLSAPVLGTAYSDTTGMRVTWTSVSDATGYQIWRRENNTGKYTKIATVSSGTTTYYVDKTAVNGTDYGYTVRAVFKGDDGATYTSGWNNPTSVATYHAAPTVTTAATGTGINVYWSLDSEAVGYRIYQKVGTGSTKVLANVSASSITGTQGRYVITGLTSGTTYTYYVRAYYGSGTLSQVGVARNNDWSESNSSKMVFLAAPTLSSSTTNTNSGLKITWSKVDAAAGYRIYRKTGSSGTWSLIGTVSSGSTVAYVDTDTLSSGTIYYYTVRAVGSDKTSLSAYNSTGVFGAYLPAPELVSVKAASSGTTVTWKAVSGASGYQVYRRTASGSWSRLTTISGGSTVTYLDTAVKSSSTVYYYTVKAYKTATVGGKTQTSYGAYSSTGITFSIAMSGSGWVKKDGNTYYVQNGYCLTGWQYLSRNGGTYKYYFDTKTGALVTNLYSYFGKSYRTMKCRVVVCLNSDDSNPSYFTIYLYDSTKDSYCIPAVSVRCVGNLSKTTYSNSSKSAYMKAGTGQRWLDSGSYEQYATYISGTYSWFHSALYYGSKSPYSFSSASYNSLVNNNNSSNGCVRMQCIYAYLIQDIMKNGYGKSNRVPVVLYKRTSNAGPFGVPKVSKISSRSSDPTDPAVTGKFFYATSIWGVSAKAGASAWVSY